MIDPITEQILLEDLGISSLKAIANKIETALRKGDFKTLERINDKLPSANMNQIKMRASKFPKFRQKYDEVKRIIKNSKVLEPEIHEPASVAIAIVAASTDMKVSDVLARGEQGLVQGKLLSLIIPGAGAIGPIVKLIFFIIILIPIFSAAGVGFGAAMSAVWKMGGFLLAIIKNALTGVTKLMIDYKPPETKTFWDSLVGGLGMGQGLQHPSAVDPGTTTSGLHQLFFKVKK
jgi:hypothetical protein